MRQRPMRDALSSLSLRVLVRNSRAKEIYVNTYQVLYREDFMGASGLMPAARGWVFRGLFVQGGHSAVGCSGAAALRAGARGQRRGARECATLRVRSRKPARRPRLTPAAATPARTRGRRTARLVGARRWCGARTKSCGLQMHARRHRSYGSAPPVTVQATPATALATASAVVHRHALTTAEAATVGHPPRLRCQRPRRVRSAP